MGILPDNFHPNDRAQAQVLANERGSAWYMPPESGRPLIYFVERTTPLDEPGKCVLGGNTWAKYEVVRIVQELNRAHLLGLRQQTN